MLFLEQHILTLTIFSPLLGVALLLLLPKKYEEASREIALFSSLVTFVLSLLLGKIYLAEPAAFYQVVTKTPWIAAMNIDYFVGIDGVSLTLILLTTLLTPLCVLCSWTDVKKQRKLYMIFLMLVEIGLLGAFAALDLFLFYIFWEIMLIPMYFLVGIWGGANRLMASMKLLIYTIVGSLFMLVAILYLYWVGGKTFDLTQLYQLGLGTETQLWLFAAFALAFAIKVPVFPVHTWLPDAHTEAPTAGSVLLAGVFLKVGTYGFYRFAMPLFPDAVMMAKPLFMTLAVIGIVGGAFVSMVQPDVKKLIAYSSVSHLGFVVLGLFALTPEAVQGAVVQMINHGVSTGALFLIFGMLYERTHTRRIADYGGIAKRVPILTVCFIYASLSSLGMPGLNNFVGEFLVLLGTFRDSMWHAIIAAVGIIIAAVYLLWMIERVFFGPMHETIGDGGVPVAKLKDMNGREFVLLVPLLVLILWLGVYPRVILDKTQPSVDRFIQLVKQEQSAVVVDGGRISLTKDHWIASSLRSSQ